MKVILAAFLLCAPFIVNGGTIIECEQFAEKGGWLIDSLFIDEMGSSYLLAHGLGRTVEDAATSVEIEKPGKYYFYVRTKNWTAPWSKHAAGIFAFLVDGKTLSDNLGTEGNGAWIWQRAGEVSLSVGAHELRLKDLTGFDGRVGAILFR